MYSAASQMYALFNMAHMVITSQARKFHMVKKTEYINGRTLKIQRFSIMPGYVRGGGSIIPSQASDPGGWQVSIYPHNNSLG